MTTRDLIAAALRKLEVVGIGATVTANDEEVCREALNLWLDAQNADTLALYALGRTVQHLVAGQATYTIGTGGTPDWTQARPAQIEAASVILDPGAATPVELPLGRPLTWEEYQALAVKTTTAAYPSRYYYDRDRDSDGNGAVTVYPVPDSSVPDMVLYAKRPLTQVTADAVTDELLLPPGYARMLVYNLTVEVAPEFGQVVTPEVARAAAESLARVRKANWRPSALRFPRLFAGPRRFDIYRGE